jgi:uncharacterized protein
VNADDPHLPRPAPIDGYGKGGFRFADLSHRGSILCLPAGIWAWPVVTPADITEGTLARVFAASGQVELFLLGTGTDFWPMPQELRWRFRDAAIRVDVMQTGPAIRTYNILFAEGRRVGAGLIAVA